VTASFSRYDSRGYRTLDAVAGYAVWAPFYDATMDDRLDLPLLRSLVSVDWGRIAAAVDLGCGTGRIGAWLKERGVARVDGVDASSAMLERAGAKRIYDRLVCADAAASGLVGQGYDLAISSFAICHLGDLGGFYTETARLIRPGGTVVLIDYHPFMLLKGVPTHFRRAGRDRQRCSYDWRPRPSGVPRRAHPDGVARATGRCRVGRGKSAPVRRAASGEPCRPSGQLWDGVGWPTAC
jgi:SAM-dependent methyltransferase